MKEDKTMTSIDGYQLFARSDPIKSDCVSLDYGRFYPIEGSPDDASCFLLPNMLSGSDYSGSDYTQANYNAFLAAYGDLPGIYTVYGGLGTYAIAISLEAYQAGVDGNENYADMLAALHALEDYPIIDDEELYQVRQEWQDKEWDDWACSEYLAALECRFDLEFTDVSTEDVRQVFELTAGQANEYWESENSSSWIDVHRMADATEYANIQDWIDWLRSGSE